MSKINITARMADREAFEYEKGIKSWSKDLIPSAGNLTWKRKGLEDLIRSAMIDAEKNGLLLPYNLPIHGPWIGRSKASLHTDSLDDMVSAAARMAGWIKAAIEFKTVTKVLKRVVSLNGMKSPYTVVNLWDLSRTISPGALARRIGGIIERADNLLKPIGLRASVDGVAIAATKHLSLVPGRAAFIAAAMTVCDEFEITRSPRSYREARDALVKAFENAREARKEGLVARLPWEFVATGIKNAGSRLAWAGVGWKPTGFILPDCVDVLKLNIVGAYGYGKILKKLSFKWKVGTSHDLEALMSLVVFFSGDVPKINTLLERTAAVGISLHDTGINLKCEKGSKDKVDWILKTTKNSSVLSNEATYIILVINSWDGLVKKGWVPHAKGSFESAKVIITSMTYAGATHDEFAKESAQWAINKYRYSEIESRWLEGIAKLRAQYIPAPGGVAGLNGPDGLRLIQLDKEDPRAVFIGNHTGCCQHPEGAGSTSAWYSHESENAVVWVCERHGRVLAESFVWREANVVVLDNIEAMGHHSFYDDIRELFERAATNIIGKLGVTHVYQGLKHSDIDCYVIDDDDHLDVKLPKNVYSDACSKMRIA